MDHMYPGDTWYMADVVPTRRATLHMVADDKVTYRTFGGNLREGTWRCIVLGKNATGVDSKVYWTMQDIEGVDDGPLAPPVPAILPSVQVSYTGHYNGGRWHRINNWNDVAYTIDAWFSYVLAEDIEIRKTAVRATAGLSDPLDRLDALRRFVRDRIVLMDSGDVPAGVETAADVLRQRSADGFMAGMLLFAMANELGLPVRPVLARSIDAGPFDDSIHGRLLFSDLLVESLDHPGVYFSAVGEPGPNHELPYHLLGARAMWVASGLQEKVRAIDEEAWQAGKSHSMERYYEEFYQRVSAQKWHTMFTLPGDAREKQGEIAEDVTWTAGSDTLLVGLRATGHLDRLDLSPGAPRSSADLSQYCQWRFPEATLVDTATTDSGLRLGRPRRLPARTRGRDLTIPPAFMYGNRFLPEWEPGASTQLFCPATCDQVRVWRMAIPEGWTLATEPTAVSVDLPRLDARATASITDGTLVVERRWTWRRGMVIRASVEPLSEAIAAIRAFEMTPIVLIRE
ncbi:MAG: transglutaminase domain-containing protein [bacterium]|nr:transglutaminase domain-containing protein [bacterium]